MIAQSGEGADERHCGSRAVTRRMLIGGVMGAGLLEMLPLGTCGQNEAMAEELAAGPYRGAGDHVLFTSDAPRVYTRAQWKARPPRHPAKVIDEAPDHIIVHHTATPNSRGRSLAQAFALSRSIQNIHMERNGWDDAGQQLTISRGGIVMEGRNRSLRAIGAGDLAVGAQVLHHNRHTIGIENEGTYMTSRVPGALWRSLVEVCVWLCRKYDLDPSRAIVGHRDFNKTSCPGDVLYARLPELRRSVASRLEATSSHNSTGQNPDGEYPTDQNPGGQNDYDGGSILPPLLPSLDDLG
ncbi:peptidoglycan recognition family protein [Actinomadura sp. WMMA1423]|uniref:peptidoglycan recognition protein family protein n=1 Tax=Actinomadura sp. WMMA1423 TaxID=2591108 RepID=UPI001F1158A6|nr:peptidoglycan recognition family protein [Actinomadura sp. WMMA1423]